MKKERGGYLSDLLHGVRYSSDDSITDTVIKNITVNSKRVKRGDLFIAIDGAAADGHHFIEEAAARGASAVVCERPSKRTRSVPQVVVDDTRLAVSEIAARFYRNPSGALKIIGITGTNGKTTVSYLLESVLKAAGFAVGVLGTVNYRFGRKRYRSFMTTPDPLTLHALLEKMVRSRMEYVIMEVSSHALEQKRIAGINFDEVIVTNISEEHLDYHGSMRSYVSAKRRIFSYARQKANAILNADDSRVMSMNTSPCRKRLTYGIKQQADIRACDIMRSLEGSRFTVTAKDGAFNVTTSLAGDHNIENILACIAACKAEGIAAEDIRQGIASCSKVPGRLESIRAGQPFKVFVDYAHTDAALHNILKHARSTHEGDIITVFGCGGDRDTAKRPRMGKIASVFSDWVIITSDNPRNENPRAIVNDIVKGIRARYTHFEVVLGRAEAIRRAMERATPGSIVLLAGKGHEKYQITGGARVPFDDRNVALACLKKRFAPQGRLFLGEIRKAAKGKLCSGSPAAPLAASGIATDSRSIRKGQFFVALKGPRFDGHNFLKDVFDKGACGALVSRQGNILAKRYPNIVQVADTLKAYGDIAAAYRLKFNIPSIAVTGSNGKTTVKEMIAHILSGTMRLLKSPGTENNYVGVPRAVLRLRSVHEAMIIELGMSRSKEIETLSRIARPTVGVITNVGPSHLAFLGSLRNVFRAKRELVENLPREGVAFVNGDDVFLSTIKTKSVKIVTFGLKKHCDVRAERLRFVNNTWKFTVNARHRFALRLPGRHNVYNALAALAVCSWFGISIAASEKRLHSFVQPPMRLVRRRLSGITILDDCYNANPLSMRCALEALREYRSRGRRILVAGDMSELGRLGEKFHRDLGTLAARSGIDFLITIGALSEHTSQQAKKRGMSQQRAVHCRTHEEVARTLNRFVRSGDVILLKASRSIHLEDALTCYTTSFIR